jgi:hypothetical protein
MVNRRKRLSILVGIVLAAAAGAGAYWVTSAPHRVRPASEKLSVEAEHLNFGETWENREFAWTIPIQNRSREAVEILDFQRTCNCAAVEPPSLVVPAGETVPVRFVLDLTRRARNATTEGTVRDFQIQVAPILDRNAPLELIWTLRGRVRTALAVESRVVELGEVVRGQPCSPKTVTVTPKTPVKDVAVRCEPPVLSVSVRRPAKDGDRFALDIAPRDGCEEGPITCKIEVRAVTRNGELLPAVTLHAEGIMKEDIQASPPTVTFGAVAVGQREKETIVLRSVSGQGFKVLDIKTPSGDTTVTPLKLKGSDATPTNAFEVAQLVSRLGHGAAPVRFLVQPEKGGKPLTVVLPVAYYGVEGKK